MREVEGHCGLGNYVTYATFLENDPMNLWISCDHSLFSYCRQNMQGRSEATSRRSGAVWRRDIFTTKMFGSIQILNTLSNVGFYGLIDEVLQQRHTDEPSGKVAEDVPLSVAE